MVKLFIKLIIYFKLWFGYLNIDIGNLFFEILIVIFKMIMGKNF